VAGLDMGHSKLFIFVKLLKNKLKGFLQIILNEIMKKKYTCLEHQMLGK
jgi:hypothetical protein